MKRFSKLKEMFYYKGYNKRVIRLVLLVIFGLVIDVTTFPNIIKQMLDVEIPSKNIYGIILFGLIYISFTILSCYIVLKYCKVRFNIRRSIENDLRKDIFKKLQEVNIAFYDENTTGEILQFLSNDSDDASNLFPIICVEMMVMGIFRILVIEVLLLFINFKIGIGIILIYLFGIIASIILNKKTIKMLNRIRLINANVINYMNEGIEGFTAIKTLGIEKEQIEKLEKAIDTYNIEQNKINKVVEKYNCLFQIISMLTMVWLIFMGTIDLTTGIITYGILTIIIDWTDTIKSHARFILKHLTDFNKSYIAFYKILEFINSKEVENLNKGKKLEKIEQIEFQNVGFSYNENERVLTNLNLVATSKEKIALVGKTGSGKSTTVNMICRFYEPTKGKILINGNDVKEYKIKDLRSKIGYVMQDISILKYTIIDNIKYVNSNITIEEIQNIFKRLHLHDKIMSLKDNYETNIYNYPDILSKGEKQLINFARIMALNPDIIILDEVTSSLSYSSEMLLKNAIKEITKNKICFIIAHRLSTIKECSQILVMENGQIVEKGNHQELIAKKR